MSAFYRLHPAYRHGKDTPWGGDMLRRVYGKPIPDDHTGEALEASTLPGLESTTDDGRTLTQVAGGPLPLLLKLIDAREALSVQVHPDDAYAAAHAQGKLGKTEAWLILHAEPDARLVYGLTPGTDACALQGAAIASHLRWMPVQAGDVLYIPAGMVHAIGGGILLYEIQQSSDVTYRFWDWGRVDEDGKPRPLHWREACDVARADLQLDPVQGVRIPCEGGCRVQYLDTAYFSLDRLCVQGRMALPQRKGFQYVTALGEGRLVCGTEALVLRAGETAYVPPAASGIHAEGTFDLLVSAEGAGLP